MYSVICTGLRAWRKQSLVKDTTPLWSGGLELFPSSLEHLRATKGYYPFLFPRNDPISTHHIRRGRPRNLIFRICSPCASYQLHEGAVLETFKPILSLNSISSWLIMTVSQTLPTR